MFMGAAIGSSMSNNAAWMAAQQNQAWYASYRADLDRQAMSNAELRNKIAAMDAEIAQQLLLEGRGKIEKAKRDQARAAQEAAVAEQRRADRERMAGLTKGLSGTDAALDAMAANTRASKERAAADNLRSGVLGKATDDDAAINAALAAVDGTAKPTSFAEKMAALKKN